MAPGWVAVDLWPAAYVAGPGWGTADPLIAAAVMHFGASRMQPEICQVARGAPHAQLALQGGSTTTMSGVVVSAAWGDQPPVPISAAAAALRGCAALAGRGRTTHDREWCVAG